MLIENMIPKINAFTIPMSFTSDLIMWLNPNFGTHGTKWLKAKVNKQGDIKEAYASVILDRQINSVKLFNNEKLDNNVH